MSDRRRLWFHRFILALCVSLGALCVSLSRSRRGSVGFRPVCVSAVGLGAKIALGAFLRSALAIMGCGMPCRGLLWSRRSVCQAVQGTIGGVGDLACRRSGILAVTSLSCRSGLFVHQSDRPFSRDLVFRAGVRSVRPRGSGHSVGGRFRLPGSAARAFHCLPIRRRERTRPFSCPIGQLPIQARSRSVSRETLTAKFSTS